VQSSYFEFRGTSGGGGSGGPEGYFPHGTYHPSQFVQLQQQQQQQQLQRAQASEFGRVPSLTSGPAGPQSGRFSTSDFQVGGQDATGSHGGRHGMMEYSGSLDSSGGDSMDSNLNYRTGTDGVSNGASSSGYYSSGAHSVPFGFASYGAGASGQAAALGRSMSDGYHYPRDEPSNFHVSTGLNDSGTPILGERWAATCICLCHR
jgi:hypothetical protein